MGNFYTNFIVIGAEPDAVVETVRSMSRRAYVVAGERRQTLVYDRDCEDQWVPDIEELGARLSEKLKSPVVASLNHHDDQLVLWCFNNGRMARYKSCFDAFVFAWRITRVRHGIISFPFVAAALLWPIYIFEVVRHLIVVKLLDFPIAAAASGFNYISRGELPPGVEKDELIEIEPDLRTMWVDE